MLDGLDLSSSEARCYELLVAEPQLTVDEVGDRAGFDPDRTREALAGLADKDLVSVSPEDPSRVVPAPPDMAVEMLILRQRERFEQARIYAVELMDRYRDGDGPGDVADHVELVRGADAVRQRFQQLERSARRELTVFVKAPLLTPTDAQVRLERQLLANGVHVRGLYERCAVEEPDGPEQALRLIPDGEDARVLPELPMKLAIADRSLGLVPFDAGDGDAAFLIHPCGLLDAVIALADRLWDLAAPITTIDDVPPPAGEPRLSRRDQAVLHLLQTGLTDHAIARRLGTSERTIGRRVRRLMDLAGAETRFQLGWRAMERGWLADLADRGHHPPVGQYEPVASPS